MNVFFLDTNPVVAANYLCKQHVVKMVLESAQLLSTYCNLINNRQEECLYKSTHVNHPSAKWLRQNRANYTWLAQHALAMCDVYNKHTNKNHASRQIIIHCLDTIPANVVGELSDIYLAMPIEIKSKYGYVIDDGNYLAPVDNAVNAYREYYKTKQFKKGEMTWYANKPEWY